MDDDEAIARALQAQEMQAAQALQSQLTVSDQSAAFDERLKSCIQTALRCEDRTLQERALAVMPLAQLRAEARDNATLAVRLGGDAAEQAPAEEDLLAKGLLVWFKRDFFTWVDTLPCGLCGAASTSNAGMGQPTSDDLAGGAARVELHQCRQPGCRGAVTRFPRYNDPGRLLQQGCRRGRCGEWANAFLLCCRAAGLTARYVTDWSDHVWTEYYSHRHRRWIHLDSCEASYDQPLLYEQGWAKAQSYVVAVGAWGAVDVTARYTANWRETKQRRRLVDERWLGRRLDALTTGVRAAWPPLKRLVWLGRDAEERVELLRKQGREPPSPAELAALPGRQTGSLEWRQQRGETGAAAAPPASTSAPAAAGRATSYRLAGDARGQLPDVFAAAGRIAGGACRAAGHNETQEVVERLFDGRTATKWLDFDGGGRGGSTWLEYRLTTDLPAAVVGAYELVSANDSPERDPAAWRLEGVTQADFEQGRVDQWTLLDQRSGVCFPGRHIPLAFSLPAPSPPCRRLRLAISATSDPAAANSCQLACWNLYGADGATSTPGQALQRLREALAGPGCDPAAVGLLGRLLANVQRAPQEAKFRKVRSVKVQALLASAPLAEALLRHVGFRPLIVPAHEPGAGLGPGVPAGEDVCLALAPEASGAELKRVAEVLALLPP
ncbi:hypothetical protein HYH03_005371 [Edaphochlamys debaryana]|uniref:Transglutaminase-like domain-containing protein n=1 Tax=Edaphochlamys debaryana TaxID=47281 RepID=A0A835Y5U1_9CHLO|nr:hypothetical protein HYH03_005371 [Edaphochlamys debaryana]|eukprot:KAG2496548.1 hypothetical protein HYH03_005371 [Edaphochlamys debaryana]